MTEDRSSRHLKLAQDWLLKQEEPEYVEGNLGAARIVRLAALLASVEQEQRAELARRAEENERLRNPAYIFDAHAAAIERAETAEALAERERERADDLDSARQSEKERADYAEAKLAAAAWELGSPKDKDRLAEALRYTLIGYRQRTEAAEAKLAEVENKFAAWGTLGDLE